MASTTPASLTPGELLISHVHGGLVRFLAWDSADAEEGLALVEDPWNEKPLDPCHRSQLFRLPVSQSWEPC